MRRLLSALRAGWFLTLLCAVLLSLLIWFVGPLVAVADYRPLASDTVRVILVLLILVAWGVGSLFAQMRAREKNKRLLEEMSAGPAAGPDAAASAEEVAVVGERFRDAVGRLKSSRLGGAGRNYLYQLPWYVVIGPPGAGKTTALINSGLKFLLEGPGKGKLQGVGGTRNCDWWFTDEAVLIDTAGRYTTQDSQEAVDSAGWKGFLDLLRKYRPRQPINGALVAISLSDLMAASEAERTAHARAIRLRIRELADALRVRFPVYVLFTKADLIAGFTEFFDDLDREQREQVWGMTFPFDEDETGEPAVARFDAEFDLLLQRLNDRMLTRIHQEPDLQRRTLVLGFPTQFGSLKPVARAFLEEIFQPSRFEARPLLRGVYFTSGTQEGTPIDRVMGAMAASFGLDPQRLTAHSGGGRSYFLSRLLREVIFREASLVSTSRRAERRRRWAYRAACAAGVLILLGAGGLWFMSYAANRQLIAQVEAATARYKEQVAGLDAPVGDGALHRVLPALNTLRDMPAGYAHRDEPVPAAMRFGLYQGDKLGSQAVDAYYRALNGLMLPRLLFRLEEQIARNLDRPEFLYEALKIYLMLGGEGPLDPDLVRQWMVLDWRNAYPGEANDGGRQALSAHLDAMLERPLRRIALNGPLIDEARRSLTQYPLAERAYSLVKQLPAARRLAEWRVVDHGGPAVARVFVRKSGKPLSEGIPGLYTYRGFHEVFLPALDDVAQEVARNSWVLGDPAKLPFQEEPTARLKRNVMALYLDDYAARWDALLADLALVPFKSQQHAIETLNSLAGPNSPLRLVLQAIARETKLSAPPESAVDKAAAAAGAMAEKKLGAVATSAARIGALLGADERSGGEAPPGKFIEDRFRRIHELVDSGGGAPAPIDQTVQQLNQVYEQLQRMAASPSQGELFQPGVGGGAAILDLRTTASRLPEPVSSWLAPVAAGTAVIRVSGARARLDAIWKSEVLPLCRQALQGRYPFDPGSGNDVTLTDFARLFAPNGLIDTFFNTHLRPFVDTSKQPWRWEQVENVDLGISSDVLAQFQRAEKIRNAFFPGGGKPEVRFEMVPLSLSPDADQVLVEIDGQTLTYGHGPTRPQELQWPGPGPGQARVTFSPPAAGRSTISTGGPWALFRLIDQSYVQRTALTDRFTVSFSVGGRSAAFEVRAGSVLNPFAMPELKAFRCPSTL